MCMWFRNARLQYKFISSHKFDRAMEYQVGPRSQVPNVTKQQDTG